MIVTMTRIPPDRLRIGQQLISRTRQPQSVVCAAAAAPNGQAFSATRSTHGSTHADTEIDLNIYIHIYMHTRKGAYKNTFMHEQPTLSN